MSSNADDEALERRLAAVERAVDSEGRDESGGSVADADALERRLDDLESRVDELDAALQAVRGFLGGVDAVNEAVESRADAAVAAVDRLERRLDEADGVAVERDQRTSRDDQSQVNTETAEAETVRDGQECRGRNEDGAQDVGESPREQPSHEPERTLRERLNEQW